MQPLLKTDRETHEIKVFDSIFHLEYVEQEGEFHVQEVEGLRFLIPKFKEKKELLEYISEVLHLLMDTLIDDTPLFSTPLKKTFKTYPIFISFHQPDETLPTTLRKPLPNPKEDSEKFIIPLVIGEKQTSERREMLFACICSYHNQINQQWSGVDFKVLLWYATCGTCGRAPQYEPAPVHRKNSGLNSK